MKKGNVKTIKKMQKQINSTDHSLILWYFSWDETQIMLKRAETTIISKCLCTNIV